MTVKRCPWVCNFKNALPRSPAKTTTTTTTICSDYSFAAWNDLSFKLCCSNVRKNFFLINSILLLLSHHDCLPPVKDTPLWRVLIEKLLQGESFRRYIAANSSDPVPALSIPWWMICTTNRAYRVPATVYNRKRIFHILGHAHAAFRCFSININERPTIRRYRFVSF